MMDGTDDSAPRYMQIAAHLTADIEAGRYPVGTLLPTERELCARYDCSRHTAREALRQLVERGLVARRQGSGSVVMTARARGRYVQTVESLDELTRYSEDARLIVRGKGEIVGAECLPQQEGVPPGSQWIRIEGPRQVTEGMPPICWTVIFLRADLGIVLPEIGTRSVPVYRMIEEQAGERIMEVVQTLDATGVARAIAGELQCRAGSPALQATRRYVGRNRQTLMLAESVYPAGRTRFVTLLRRRPANER